jgi:hypothetical protein
MNIPMKDLSELLYTYDRSKRLVEVLLSWLLVDVDVVHVDVVHVCRRVQSLILEYMNRSDKIRSEPVTLDHQ